jgi:NTP pyrophosphatase (non-canonical NTP hydrolase)
MKLQEYQQQAKRTCPSLGDIRLDLAHMAMGINSEIVEMQEALKTKDYINLSEELIDAHWYIANYCTFRDIDYTEINEFVAGVPTGLNSNGLIDALYEEVCLFQDVVKKYIAYNKPMEDEEIHLARICWFIRDLAERKGINLEDGADKNIAKLKKRYPDGFTEKSAINRDTDAERKILEA